MISANYSPKGLIDPTLSNFQDSWAHRLRRRIQGSGATDMVKKVQNMWQNYPQLDESDLSKINAPALVIAGEDDEIALQHTQKMVANLASAELHLILNAGHLSLMTHPDEVNKKILEFFNTSEIAI